MKASSGQVRKPGTNQIVPLAAVVTGIVFVWLALARYGFWHPAKGPLPGFVPLIIGAILALVGVVAFLQSFREESAVWPRANWLVVLSGALIFGATFVVGLVPAVAIYAVVWLRVYEKCSWKTTMTTSIAIMAVVIGVFVLWLGVPFPKGFVLDAILR